MTDSTASRPDSMQSGGPLPGHDGGVPAARLPASATGRPQPKLSVTRPLPPDQRLGWAVCGLGHFAQNEMIPALERTGRARLTGLVSGSRDKAAAVAAAYGVPSDAVYDYAMDGLAQDDRIDVVYVITPNAVHVDNVLKAFEAGKHVLCEKPFGNSAQECRRMIDAARAADRKLMVAYRAHFEPHNVAAKAMLDGGALGSVSYATAMHHRPLDPEATQDAWRMQRDIAGGGSLVDIGIYSLNGVLYFFDETPSALVANVFAPEGDPRFAEVEATCHVQMIFPSGRRADISSGYLSSRKRITLWGSDAVAELDPATNYQGNRLVVHRTGGSEEVTGTPSSEQQFMGEIDHFCEAITDGTPIRTPGEMGLRDVLLMQAIYHSARSRAWVTLRPDGSMAS